jgi:polysaccharide biosynthesis/export protein
VHKLPANLKNRVSSSPYHFERVTRSDKHYSEHHLYVSLSPDSYIECAFTPEYRLGPEDVIEVFVYKEPDLSTTVTVRPDGRISLPLAGELDAAGKTATQLQQEIAEGLKRYVSGPVVNVMVKQINSLKVSVLGEVRKPDVYRIKNRVTVLDAIAMAGGFTDLARPNRVVVLRNTPSGQQRIKININQVVADNSSHPFYLEPMDTVYVEGR